MYKLRLKVKITHNVSVFRCDSISRSDDWSSLTHWLTEWKFTVLYHQSSHNLDWEWDWIDWLDWLDWLDCSEQLYQLELFDWLNWLDRLHRLDI